MFLYDDINLHIILNEIFDADNFKEDFELSQEYYKKIDTDLISNRKFWESWIS